MDMVGLRYIEADKLKECDMICFEDWRNDLKVISIVKNKDKIKVTVKGFEGEPFEKEYSKKEIIVILKRFTTGDIIRKALKNGIEISNEKQSKNFDIIELKSNNDSEFITVNIENK